MTAGGYKAGIIYDADCLMPQAQNAFLKTLEEPAKKTLFILATENPGSFLPTIRSRCQTISLLLNKSEYNFEGSSELFELLNSLVFTNSITFSKVVEVSEKMNSLFTKLYMHAENKTKTDWKEKLEEAENLDSKTARQHIKDRFTASVEAEYRLLRKYFLDGIFTWFAQLYQIKNGIPREKLTNPEILPDNINIEGVSSKILLARINKAEDFIKSFNWNINESLAIQEFCLSFI